MLNFSESKTVKTLVNSSVHVPNRCPNLVAGSVLPIWFQTLFLPTLSVLMLVVFVAE